MPAVFPCAVYVTFSPAAVGTRSGTLTVTYGAGDPPQMVALSGVATQAGFGPTVTTFAASGTAGAYSLTGTVTGTRATGSPTGGLSFVDTTNSNFSLGAAQFGAATFGLGLANGPSAPTGSESTDVVIADFNGDGKPDMAVLNDPFFDCSSASVSILLNNGDGTFTPAASLPRNGVCSSYLVEGDFNGDGKPDLATGNTLFLGNGDGTFSSQSIPTPANAQVAAAGFFNGDGNADLLVLSVSTTGSATATILLGQGNGTFVSAPGNPSVESSSGNYLYGFLAGDFNGDGKADLAFLNEPPISPGQSFPDVSLTVDLGNGDGTFQSPVTTDLGNQLVPVNGNRTLARGDFNGDGKADVVVEGSVVLLAPQATSDGFLVLAGKGDGTFSVGMPIAITPSPTYVSSSGVVTSTPSNSGSVVVADFNGDGKADLALLNEDVVQVQLGNGDGTFTVAASVDSGAESSPDNLALATGDFNGDGVTDLVATNSDAALATITLGQRTVAETATLTNVPLTGAGTHEVEAVYAGDTQFTASTSSTIALLAMAVAPLASLSPSSLTFPSEAIGIASSAQTVALTNSGTAALTLTSITASGDFAETNNCGASVAPGSSCNISVAFTPTATGSRTGILTIADNAGGSPQTIALSGTGAAAVSLSSSSPALTISAAGGTTTATIQIAPGANFTGTVNLTCAVTYQGQGSAAKTPTCSLSPAQAQITGAAAVSSVLTVSTTAATASAIQDPIFKSTGMALASLLCIGLIPRRRWRHAVICSLFLLAVAGGLLGCGDNSSSKNNNPGTTAGSYQVVVTATSGSTTASAKIPLMVQ